MCSEYEQLVTTIDDEQVFAEAAARHEAACPRCAERLAAEAGVKHALRALADADRHREAPAHIEVMARAVWRGAAVARASTVTPVARPAVLNSWEMNWWGTSWWRSALTAVAAGIAIALTGLAVAVWSSSRSGTGVATQAASTAETGSVTMAIEPPPAPTRARQVGPASAPTETLARVRRPRVAPQAASSAVASAAASASAVAGRTPPRAPSQRRAIANATAEVVFVPFPYAEPLRPTEVRQIVRIAVPQATLLMAGLTTSTPAESVVADVLVGEDGIARGIRIVR